MKNRKGQALITLVFFTVIATTVIGAAVLVVFTNISAASLIEQGLAAYTAAESGAEEGYIQLLRNPKLASNETFNELFNVEAGTVAVDINSGTITSTASLEKTVRKIQVQTIYNSGNGSFTISSWKEIP